MAYRDYEEFIAALNAHGVRYLVVGARRDRSAPEPAHYIGLDELIDAKRAVRRPQDRADLRILERAKGGTRLTTRSSRRSKTRRG